mmetsp:Transcript_13253/g.31375  ORF Transcript_13253/g.31375 Transcript_13253/m.31375 type:complete len:287 (+) Transcript_13253:1804-2664(+)
MRQRNSQAPRQHDGQTCHQTKRRRQDSRRQHSIQSRAGVRERQGTYLANTTRSSSHPLFASRSTFPGTRFVSIILSFGGIVVFVVVPLRIIGAIWTNINPMGIECLQGQGKTALSNLGNQRRYGTGQSVHHGGLGMSSCLFQLILPYGITAIDLLIVAVTASPQNADPNTVQTQTRRLDAPSLLLQALVSFVVAQGQRRHLDRLLSAHRPKFVETRSKRVGLILEMGQGCSSDGSTATTLLFTSQRLQPLGAPRSHLGMHPPGLGSLPQVGFQLGGHARGAERIFR